jgi:predicted RNase H-like nuclease (RuvC/YqgF family)
MTDSERQRMIDLQHQADWWKLKALEYYKEIRNANKGIQRLKRYNSKLKDTIVELKTEKESVVKLIHNTKKSQIEGCLHE